MWSARRRGTTGPRPSERLGIPHPLMRSPRPSGRGATEQPNVTSDGDTALTPLFWMVLVATGVAAGLFGDLLMFILYHVEHLAFGFNSGSLEDGARHASDLRRLTSLLLAGLVGGIAWYLLRRYSSGKSEIDASIWKGDGTLWFGRSFGASLISIVTSGMGASLGREAAPKLMGGASASVLASWARLSVGQRRLLGGCRGGAGPGAVPNGPLGRGRVYV